MTSRPEARRAAPAALGGGLPVPIMAVEGHVGHAWFARAGGIEVRRPTPLPAAMRRAEVALAGQGRELGRRALRIPADNIITVRSRPLLPPPSHPLRLEAPKAAVGANDNPPTPLRARLFPGGVRQTLWFLLLLAITLIAVYQLGRIHAAQNIISLPDAALPGSRIT